jgi:hypothetical protein
MKKIFLLYFISIWCLHLQAQNQLTRSVKNDVVNNLCKSLLDNYIFEDTAIKYEKFTFKKFNGRSV